MAPAHFKVRRLARDAGMDVDEAILRLMEAGFGVERPDDIIPRKEADRARAVLGPPARAKPAIVGFEWPQMRASPVTYLATDQVEAIHSALTAEFAGTEDAVWPPGVKDRPSLESAVTRPRAAQQKFPNVQASGAALVHSLINNHPFHNGNKRTALISLVVFLEVENEYFIEFDEDEIFELIVATAAHTLVKTERDGDPFYADRELLQIYTWLQHHTAVPAQRERRLQWRQLERILYRFDCTIELKSNQRKVRLGNRSVVTGTRNPGDELDPFEIRRIRRDLGLVAENGIDSHVFYEGATPHPDLGEIIQRFRGVLRRLALLDRT